MSAALWLAFPNASSLPRRKSLAAAESPCARAGEPASRPTPAPIVAALVPAAPGILYRGARSVARKVLSADARQRLWQALWGENGDSHQGMSRQERLVAWVRRWGAPSSLYRGVSAALRSRAKRTLPGGTRLATRSA